MTKGNKTGDKRKKIIIVIIVLRADELKISLSRSTPRKSVLSKSQIKMTILITLIAIIRIY